MQAITKKPLVQGSVAVITNDGARQTAGRHGLSKPLVKVMEVRGDVAYITQNQVGLSAGKVMTSTISDVTVNDGVRLIQWKGQRGDGYLEEYHMPLVPVPLAYLEVR